VENNANAETSRAQSETTPFRKAFPEIFLSASCKMLMRQAPNIFSALISLLQLANRENLMRAVEKLCAH
jgi:hypothetical protein